MTNIAQSLLKRKSVGAAIRTTGWMKSMTEAVKHHDKTQLFLNIKHLLIA